MVGHTHEDIDQFFSCIARILNKFKVLTLSQLLQKIKQVNRKDPVEAEILDHLYNIRDWIDGFITDLHGHLKSYQFKFEVEGEGVRFSYKKRSTATEWVLVDQSKFPIFEDLPTGQPRMVASSFEEMKVPLFSRHLRDTYSNWMPQECSEEWEEWIKKTEEEIDGQNTAGNQNTYHKDRTSKEKILNLRPLVSQKNQIFFSKLAFHMNRTLLSALVHGVSCCIHHMLMR